MQLVFAYQFSSNVFYADISLLRFMLWLIPINGVFYFLRFNRAYGVLFLSLVAILLLSYREYYALNQRYTELNARPESISLTLKNGQVQTFLAKDIQQFTSISIGRYGGHSCSLMLKTKHKRIFSLVVEKQQHSCQESAQRLNRYYKIKR